MNTIQLKLIVTYEVFGHTHAGHCSSADEGEDFTAPPETREIICTKTAQGYFIKKLNIEIPFDVVDEDGTVDSEKFDITQFSCVREGCGRGSEYCGLYNSNIRYFTEKKAVGVQIL